MSLTEGTILTDRSRVVLDWKCRRARYYGYEYGGIGLQPSSSALELFLGSVLHDGLAAIAQPTEGTSAADIDFIATIAYKAVYTALTEEQDERVEEFAQEQATLIEGLLRGFYRHVWPRLIASSKVVTIEQELLYDYRGMMFMSRPDIMILESTEGNLHYIEYKSTSNKKDVWINSWSFAIQLHSTVRAIEATLGRPVESVQVIGLYKGHENYGKLATPMCYAYKRSGTPPFSKDEISYEYRQGFRRYPTWELPGGVKDWVASMPENILAEQFPYTPPIFVKKGLVDAFFEQLYMREQEIKLANQMLETAKDDPETQREILAITYPQNFEACYPPYGQKARPCPFLNLCHGAEDKDPLMAGFEWRIPNHKMEQEAHLKLDNNIVASPRQGGAK